MKTYLDVAGASQYLFQHHGISRAVQTLNKLRVFGNGPMFFKLGKSVRYTPEHLDAWAQSITTYVDGNLPSFGRKLKRLTIEEMRDRLELLHGERRGD